jgi:hypothetical protein
MVLPMAIEEDAVVFSEDNIGTSATNTQDVVIDIDEDIERPDDEVNPVKNKTFHMRMQSVVHRHQFDLLPSVVDIIHQDLVQEAVTKSDQLTADETEDTCPNEPAQEIQPLNKFGSFRGVANFVLKEYQVSLYLSDLPCSG